VARKWVESGRAAAPCVTSLIPISAMAYAILLIPAGRAVALSAFICSSAPRRAKIPRSASRIYSRMW